MGVGPRMSRAGCCDSGQPHEWHEWYVPCASHDPRGHKVINGFDVRFVERKQCGEEVVTACFERPDGYEFRPGQWFRLTLQTAGGPLTETFSHASAPADPWLELATRLSGTPFKTALAALVAGDEVHVAGPGGHLLLPDDVDRVAFLVGGVGITPVRSALRDARSRCRAFADAPLFYGNRDESCIPFRRELEAMSESGVRLVNVLEVPSPQWKGERGLITAELVARYVEPDACQSFFVTGPPAMVTAMERVLDELEVGPQKRIVERFGAVT